MLLKRPLTMSLSLMLSFFSSLQTKNVITKLDNPYPEDGTLQIISMTGQLVDETGRAVPLDEVQLPMPPTPWPACMAHSCVLCNSGFDSNLPLRVLSLEELPVLWVDPIALSPQVHTYIVKCIL